MRGSFFTRRLWPVAGAAAWLFFACPAGAVDVQRLTPAETDTLQGILTTLEPVIAAKKPDGTANILAWDELYAPLPEAHRVFLDAFRSLDAKALGATSHHFGELAEAPDIAPVGPQQVVKDGTAKPLDPQFLPRHVLAEYRRMMEAMQADLGVQLLVESGYRSPAYQLYLFLFYMPKHEFSVTETNRFVALPGYSEHGYPPHQAIDFINEAGVNGEDHPEEFEALPEYAWLQRRAGEFGFVLSYPRGNALNTAFEPWHWHYQGVGE